MTKPRSTFMDVLQAFKGNGGGGASAEPRETGEAGAQPPAPPLLTGGAECQNPLHGGPVPAQAYEVGIHWLRGSFDREKLDSVILVLSLFFGTRTETTDRGLWTFGHKRCWPIGVFVVYDEIVGGQPSESVKKYAAFEIQGSALETLSPADVLSLCQQLIALGCRCSRIDVYADDLRRATPIALVEEAVAGGHFTGFRVFTTRHAYENRAEGLVKVRDDVCFGRRGSNGSGKFLRIYDKGMESGGERDFIRWECEFSEDHSRQVFGDVCTYSHVRDLARYLGNLMGGCIDFRQRTGDKHLERRPRLDWWDKVVQALGECVISPKRLPKKLEAARQWVRDSVGPTLAMIHEYHRVNGTEAEFRAWLESVRLMGAWRMNAGHKQAIEAACLENGGLVYDEEGESFGEWNREDDGA